MPTLHIDMIEGARVMETQGVIYEVTRLARISGVNTTGTGFSSGSNTRDGMFLVALERQADLPKAGDSHRIFKALTLTERVAHAISSDVVEVELKYTLPPGGIAERATGAVEIEGGVSEYEIETAFDRNGNEITVEHAGDVQHGFIRVSDSRRYLLFRTSERTDAPGVVAKNYQNRVNQNDWQGGLPGQWKCREINFRLSDGTKDPPRWRYTYRFEFSETGWQPDVVYINEQTGYPPTGLVENEGYKTIPWHYVADFHQLPL